MSLGTLTQATLKSPEAQKVLKRQGLSVIKEQRSKGYDASGNQIFADVFVAKTSFV